MANAVANIQHHRICLGLRLQESQQALIAGLQHYHVLNQAIATLQRKLEVYETQNINLESMISKLKYLSNSHPQGELPET
jgi:cell division protein FtsB